MFEGRDHELGALLRDGGVVAADELAALETVRRETGKTLSELILARGLLDREALLQAVADNLGYEYLDEVPSHLPASVAALLTPQQGRSYQAVPLRAAEDCVELLAMDPWQPGLTEDLGFALGREIRLVVADPRKIAELIPRCYGNDEADLDELLHELDGVEAIAGGSDELSARELKALAAQAPVIRFVNLVLAQAVRDRASDIHFEPFEREFKIRYRIDGVLHELTPPAKALALPITSRLKVLANLDIAERRLPQDGRIKLTLAGRAVDLRVSTLPTQFGESVVLRVLDQSAVGLELSDLGMPLSVREGIQETVRRPNGIFIVTGPTGSGKTTTLYSALRLINTTDRKILTVEDPVEYQIDGLMQVPVNLGAGLTFASALRSFLRQDPDVIMVGEIRDAETARIAIQAALTGHLVLTTLHTNDAAGAIIRLIDMGIEPFLIASTVEAVLAQRLVRALCPSCRQPIKTPAPAANELGGFIGEAGEGTFGPGRGCDACAGTGYRGRCGIFEWLRMDDELRERVNEKAPARALREAAMARGMRTLQDEARRAILAGETSAAEMAKYV